jgi:alanine transaminase
MNGGNMVPYYLEEERGWATGVASLSQSLAEARSQGVEVRGVAVINPGNPTGQVLPEEVMREIVLFCAKEELVLLADEVYQENIWCENKPFVSFKKVLRDLGSDHAAAGCQIASFHSTSKGFIGECGRRGGYVEFTNFSEEVKALFYKVASVGLCSNVEGQLMTGLMVNPPAAGQPSHTKYEQVLDMIPHGHILLTCTASERLCA